MSEQIQGLSEFIQKIQKLKTVPTKASLLKGAHKLQEHAQRNAPVDTGYLRSSAESRETDEGAEMVFTADYAYYQEFGSSKMPGKFYVTRALDENEDEILEAIKNEAQEKIEEVANG